MTMQERHILHLLSVITEHALDARRFARADGRDDLVADIDRLAGGIQRVVLRLVRDQSTPDEVTS